jgi:hypothetical protein
MRARITDRDARRISRAVLRRLGTKHRGRWVAIEASSGSPFVGDTSLAAVRAGLRRHPRGQFVIERLGSRVPGMLKAGAGEPVIRGRVSSDHEPLIPVTLHGARSTRIEAVLDTGFTAICVSREGIGVACDCGVSDASDSSSPMAATPRCRSSSGA